MNNCKTIKILYLIAFNFVLFYCIYKQDFFSPKICVIISNLFLSLSCLNFAIITSNKLKIFERKQIWYIISEWFLGFLIISFFTKFFFLRSSEDQFTYWVSIFCAFLLGGFLTILNYNKTFNSKTDLKKNSIYLSLLFFLYPLIDFSYYNFAYDKMLYEFSYFVTIIPHIIMVLTWQIFISLNLKKGCS
jgi:hypothetical protein